jgi:hypothetical protein
MLRKRQTTHVLTDGDSERKIVVLTSAPDTEDETKFRLAVVSGVSSSLTAERSNPAL